MAQIPGACHPESLVWLGTKSAQWVNQFYGLLFDAISELKFYAAWEWTWNCSEKQQFAKMWRIIRVESGEHRISKSVYLPNEDGNNEGFLTVQSEVVAPTQSDLPLKARSSQNRDKARAFLIAVGINQITERAHVERLLARHYGLIVNRTWADHLSDIRRFIRVWKSGELDVSEISARKICHTSSGYRCVTETFLDWPSHPTGLSSLYEHPNPVVQKRFGLDSRYAEVEGFQEFAKKLGCKVALEIKEDSAGRNPKWDWLKGSGKKTDCKTNEDYILEYSDVILGARQESLAALVWKTLRLTDGKFQTARYRPNRTAEFRTAPSQLVCKLRDTAWIPTKDGNCRTPAEMTKDDLLPEFTYDDSNGWLTAIGFGSAQGQKSKAKEELKRAVQLAGYSSKLFDALDGLDDGDQQSLFQWVTDLKRNKITATVTQAPADFEPELKKAINRSGHSAGIPFESNDEPLPNIERRSWKIEQEIEDAQQKPGALTKKVNRRIWQSKNPEIRTFLENEYSGKCQICDATFQQRNGDFNFEALHFVSRTSPGAAWMERNGNALCLCPTCCAKFKHGAIEEGQFIHQAKTWKLPSEGGTELPKLKLRLCGEEKAVCYTEKHFLDLRIMLNHSDGPTEKNRAAPQSPNVPSHPSPKPRESNINRCKDCGKPATAGDDRCYSCGG